MKYVVFVVASMTHRLGAAWSDRGGIEPRACLGSIDR